MAQMGYLHRGVVMEEEMGAVMPIPELTDKVPDRVPTRRKLPTELRIPDNGRLSLDIREAGGGDAVMEHE